MENNPKVSVIVNTYNRGHHLKRLLDCLAKQTYDNFEVIVVDGPSTDSTEDILKEYASAVRAERCPEVNLCISRNIGIRAAAGEILAFIDDDAVPANKNWIANAIRPFQDECVGIVGGAVLRINGDVEFEYGRFSIWGDNESIFSTPVRQDELQRGWYISTIGTNAFFRKEAILGVGGFDEFYAYYLDETDLCLRIQRAGYTSVYGVDMAVLHEAAGSHIRSSKYHLDWKTIARSHGYFVIKATEQEKISVDERKRCAIESCERWKRDFAWMRSEGKITREEYQEFNRALKDGCMEGIKAGLTTERKLRQDLAAGTGEFRPYDKEIGNAHLNICMYCDVDVVHPIGGSGVHTHALAYGLAERGHNVYVVTRGDEEVLRNIDGVNFLFVVPEEMGLAALSNLPVSRGRVDFSYACFIKLQQIKQFFFIDVVETPIWDTYGLVTSYLEKEVPMAVRLQTPMKMVVETFQRQEDPDTEMLEEFEAAMLEKASRIIPISDCVKDTIEELYSMKFTQPVSRNYLGFDPEVKAVRQRSENDGKLVIFFVGRLERRKGIDSILAAAPLLLEKYPNLEIRLAGDCEIVDEMIGDTYKNSFLREHRGAKWLKRIRFLGIISDEQKDREFADCDVFVSPSLYESFGIIFVEAMKYGRPVVACDAGGMREVVEDGVTGLLCRPGDAESFAQCVERLLDDAALREHMGQAGRERMCKMFTLDAMCAGSEAIYRDMVKKNARGNEREDGYEECQ